MDGRADFVADRRQEGRFRPIRSLGFFPGAPIFGDVVEDDDCALILFADVEHPLDFTIEPAWTELRRQQSLERDLFFGQHLGAQKIFDRQVGAAVVARPRRGFAGKERQRRVVGVFDLRMLVDQDHRIVQALEDRQVFVLFVGDQAVLRSELLELLVGWFAGPLVAKANLHPVEESSIDRRLSARSSGAASSLDARS